MQHNLLIAIAFAVSFIFGASTAHANDDVFVVARVPVTGEAERSTDAKTSAQAQGRRRAMDILLRRLTAEEDWAYLPTLASTTAGDPDLNPDEEAFSQPQAGFQAGNDRYGSAGPARTPIEIDNRKLIELESGFEVAGEKSSATSYRAFITYRFKPDEIRQLLKQAGIPYSEAQMRTALVLPVLQTDQDVYLWEARNPWMAAWKMRPYTNELTPLVAPLGDLEDQTRISARGALDLDQDALSAIAAHYGVSQVVIAHARLKQLDGEDQLSVRLINGYRDMGDADAAAAFDDGTDLADAVSAQQDTTVGFSDGVSDDDDSVAVGDVLGSAYARQPSGNFRSLATDTIGGAITEYASGWKQRTLIDHASESVLAVSAFFNSLTDWTRIRAALIESPLVGAAQISALSRNGAEMAVRVFGDPSRLQVSMENQGVVFWSETGERWFLATPQVASRLRGQRFLRQSLNGPGDGSSPARGSGARDPYDRYRGDATERSSYEERVFPAGGQGAFPEAQQGTGPATNTRYE